MKVRAYLSTSLPSLVVIGPAKVRMKALVIITPSITTYKVRSIHGGVPSSNFRCSLPFIFEDITTQLIYKLQNA